MTNAARNSSIQPGPAAIVGSAVHEPAYQADLLRRHWAETTQSFVESPLSALEASVADRFESIARQHADRVALKGPDASFTYAEMNSAANRLARAVNARLGESNEPVGLLFEPGSMSILALVALLKAGKIYVALDPQYPLERLASYVDDSQARLILTNAHNLPLAGQLARRASRHPQIIAVEDASPSLADDDLGLPLSPDTLGAIIYTSGSTGQPKGSMHNQRTILHFAMMLINHYRTCPEDKQGQFFSYSFSGMMSSVFPMLLSGAALLPMDLELLGVRGLADWLVENEITILHLTPQFHRQFWDSLPSRDPDRFPHLRLLAIGGGALTSRDAAQWLSHAPKDCLLSYSLASTESFAITRFFVDLETVDQYDTLPVGYPETDVTVALVDEAGKAVAPGEVGEVVVKSRYSSPGYWRKPELTESVFKPDPEESDARLCYSGDLARQRPDGMFEMVGRKDFQVKVRGFTIQPGEVEMALYDLGVVRETVVVAAGGLENARLVAYVVAKAKPTPTVSELRARLKAKLPEYSIPSAFVFLDALPQTANGKIDRAALPEPDSTRPNLAQPYVPARDAGQARLVKIWESLLGLRGIGVLDDFFDLGGDSLKAETLAIEIEELTGQAFATSSLLQAPTIEKLAALIAQPDMASSVIVPIRPEGRKPPLFLAHGLGGGLVHYAALARLLDADRPVYGVQAQEPTGNSNDFEAFVAHYVDELIGFYPSGPYLLGGFSYGAAVAYEMARQLQERGRVVAFLGIIDATLAKEYRQIKLTPGVLWGAARNLPHWFAAFSRLDSSVQRATLARWTRRFNRVLADRRDALHTMTTTGLDDYMLANAALRDGQTEQIAREWRRVKAHSFNPYWGPLTLFRARAQPILCSFDPAMNWRSLAKGQVTVEVVPGSHADMMGPRNIEALAAKMERALANATG